MNKLILSALFLCFSYLSHAQQIIHYWHFNSVSGTVDTVAADVFAGSQAPLIVYRAAFPNVLPANLGYMDNVTGDTINARLSQVAGQGIRPRNPSDSMELLIQLPTTGFENITISYATQRSGSGMLKQVLYYTTDGTTFTPHPDTVLVGTPWALVQFNLSSIAGANNNPNFAVKLRFFEQNVASNGNNRIDNFVIEGTPSVSNALSLIHYWHFNGVSGNIDSVAADVFPSVTPSFIYYSPVSPAVVNRGIMDNVAGDTINARLNEPAGQGIRPRNPSDSMELVIPLSTVGFDSIRISYALQRSGSGMLKQVLFYSTNGITFTPHPDTVLVNTAWTLVNFNLSNIAGIANNPDFIVKIRFFEQNIASNGNNRFDNFAVEGVSLGGQVTGVNLNVATLQLTINDSAQLVAGVLPTSASNQQVSWTTRNAAVATVRNNGVVLGITAGTVWIVVTTNDGGFQDSCAVTVVAPALLTLNITDGTNPLAGVEAIIGTDTLITNSTGSVVFSLIPAPYTVNLVATGYFSQSLNLNITADTTISVALNPLTAVVHYWHFNTLPIGTTTSATADFSLFPNGPVITYAGTGNGYMDDFSPGSTLNAQFGEPAGAALRVRNQSEGRALIIPLPATGCSDIRLSFDVHRSGQGMLTNVFEYTLDGGVTYQNTGIVPQTIPVTENYVTHVIDFTAVSGANYNPNFGVRITWIGNTIQSNGNNRYDNFTMLATTSSTTSVLEAKQVIAKLYPNPNKGSFHLQNVASGTSYRILNLQGQLMLEGTTTVNDQALQLNEQLSNGLYLLVLNQASGTEVLRFVVQH